MDEIVNKVANSVLQVFDLEDYYPKGIRAQIDISHWLIEGFLLKEKDFREFIKTNNWNFYQDKNVYIHCSADAIVPTWAYMLVASRLVGIAHLAAVGSKLDIQKALIEKSILEFDTSQYIDERFIIKGCSEIVDPAFAMVKLTQRLQPIAKSIMYGEPCSTVPVYKAPRK